MTERDRHRTIGVVTLLLGPAIRAALFLFFTAFLLAFGALALFIYISSSFLSAELTPEGVTISLPALVLVVLAAYFHRYIYGLVAWLFRIVRVLPASRVETVDMEPEEIFSIWFMVTVPGLGAYKVLNRYAVSAAEGSRLPELLLGGDVGIPRVAMILLLDIASACGFWAATAGGLVLFSWVLSQFVPPPPPDEEGSAARFGTAVGILATAVAVVAWCVVALLQAIGPPEPVAVPGIFGFSVAGFLGLTGASIAIGIVRQGAAVVWRRVPRTTALKRGASRAVRTVVATEPGTPTTLLMAGATTTLSAYLYVSSEWRKANVVDGYFPAAFVDELQFGAEADPTLLALELLGLASLLGVGMSGIGLALHARAWWHSSTLAAMVGRASATVHGWLAYWSHQYSKVTSYQSAGQTPGVKWTRVAFFLQFIAVLTLVGNGDIFTFTAYGFTLVRSNLDLGLPVAGSVLLVVATGMVQAWSVVYEERQREDGQPRRWATAVLLVPLVGAVAYLLVRAEAGESED